MCFPHDKYLASLDEPMIHNDPRPGRTKNYLHYRSNADGFGVYLVPAMGQKYDDELSLSDLSLASIQVTLLIFPFFIILPSYSQHDLL